MQQTAFGDVEVESTLKVDRADGSVEYYLVNGDKLVEVNGVPTLVDGIMTQIDESTYKEKGGA